MKARPDALALLVTLTVFVWLINLLATGATSWLLANHPLALIALDARNRNLVLTVPLIENGVVFVITAAARRLAADPIYYALGRLLVERDVRWMGIPILGKESGRITRALEALFERFSWPLVFLFPGMFVCMLAGATGMRVRTFALLNGVGTLCVLILTRLVALQARGELLRVSEWNAERQGEVTAVLVVVVLLAVFQRRRRGRRLRLNRRDGTTGTGSLPASE